MKIQEDLDFVLHEPPSDEQLRVFASDPSKGPSLTDPHFDVNAGLASEWNKKLLRLLQVAFQTQLPDICADQGIVLPPRTNKYYGDLVAERFQRLAHIWKQAQPKVTTEGYAESYEETELRMVSTREHIAKKQRHFSRHLFVSD